MDAPANFVFRIAEALQYFWPKDKYRETFSIFADKLSLTDEHKRVH